MQTPTAIIISSVFIGGCVLANLGYSISRDAASRAAQERQARAEADHYLKVRTKEVWKQALYALDLDLKHWMEKRTKQPYVISEFIMTKGFDLSDVQWKDAQHAVVHGQALVQFDKSDKNAAVFSWSRGITQSGDGVDNWWDRADTVFDYLPKSDAGKFKGFLIDDSGLEHFRSPLVQ